MTKDELIAKGRELYKEYMDATRDMMEDNVADKTKTRAAKAIKALSDFLTAHPEIQGGKDYADIIIEQRKIIVDKAS